MLANTLHAIVGAQESADLRFTPQGTFMCVYPFAQKGIDNVVNERCYLVLLCWEMCVAGATYVQAYSSWHKASWTAISY